MLMSSLVAPPIPLSPHLQQDGAGHEKQT